MEERFPHREKKKKAMGKKEKVVKSWDNKIKEKRKTKTNMKEGNKVIEPKSFRWDGGYYFI